MSSPIQIPHLQGLNPAQEIFVPALIDHFHGDRRRGILQVATGGGKTYGAAVWIELATPQHCIWVTPYIHLVSQARNDIYNRIPDSPSQFLLVCSREDRIPESPLRNAQLLTAVTQDSPDWEALQTALASRQWPNTRLSNNPEDIAQFLRPRERGNGRKTLISSYKSFPAIVEACRMLRGQGHNIRFEIGVFDEADEMAVAPNYDPVTRLYTPKDSFLTLGLYDRNVEIHNRLFMTATVRHHTRGGEAAISMDNEALFGTHVLRHPDGTPNPITVRWGVAHNVNSRYQVLVPVLVGDDALTQQLQARFAIENPRLARLEDFERLVASAVGMERMMADEGGTKIAVFLRNVDRAHDFAAIVQSLAQDRARFPNLAQLDIFAASGYDPTRELNDKMTRLRNGEHVLVSSNQLLLRGKDEPTLDGIAWIDPDFTAREIIQGTGRALRYIPGKEAVIYVPCFFPQAATGTWTRTDVRRAFEKVFDALDAMAEGDPVLSRGIYFPGEPGDGRPTPPIRITVPDQLKADLQERIRVAVWREMNPDTIFIDNLREDAAALDRYRLEQFPRQIELKKEAEAALCRAQIRIIPRWSQGYEKASARMGSLRRGIRAYYQNGEMEGTYDGFTINSNRVALIYQIHGWDREFILWNNFEENLKEDVLTLDKYRLEQYPKRDNPEEEAQAAQNRSEIRIVPFGAGYEPVAIRMRNVRLSIKGWLETGKKDAKYGQYAVDAERVGQAYRIYGWDEAFIMQDDFEEELKKDVKILDEYRLKKYPRQDNPADEAIAIENRDSIRLMPFEQGHNSTADRMRNLRLALRAYYENGEKDGRWGSYTITADRTEQICRIYGWDKAFAIQDDFEEDLKNDVRSLDKYRLEQFPKRDDPEEEANAIDARAQIRIIPRGQTYKGTAERMRRLRASIKAYYEGGEKSGLCGGFIMNPFRVEQTYRIYGWDKAFVMRDDFEEDLKIDAKALDKYRLEQFPKQDIPEEEAKAVEARAKIKLIPSRTKGYEITGYRMVGLRRGIKAYYENGEADGLYASRIINRDRVQQVFKIYGWDKAFVVQDDFKETLKMDAATMEIYRLQKYPKQDNPIDEVEAVTKRAQIRIIPQHRNSAVGTRMGKLRRALRVYHIAGEKAGIYASSFIDNERVEQIFQIYGWDWDFVLKEDPRGQRKSPKEDEYHRQIISDLSDMLTATASRFDCSHSSRNLRQPVAHLL